MPDEHAYDGSAINIVRQGSVELTQIAESGAEGVGTVVVDDVAGTQAIVGQKDWATTESDCANTRTFVGFVDDREFARQGGDVQERIGAGRAVTVQLTDLNNYLSQTGIIGDDGNRTNGNETVDQRLAWLTGSAYWPAGVAIGSRVASSSIVLDKADYRQQQPGDVLADLAAATGFNHYVADWGSGPELTFRDDNTSTADSSAVRISNVLSDVDSDTDTVGAAKTFAPTMDFKLARSPREVYSDMSLSFDKGTVNASDATTAAAFNGVRYGTASTSNIKTYTLAASELKRLLHVHSTERDFLTGSIIVPSSAVNLLRQGERLEVKFSHLVNTGGRDYDDWTWCRVLERTVKPLTPGVYELRLRLSPQEEAAPACVYPATSSGTYYPLGGSGSTPHPSDGVVYYLRPGYYYPTQPMAGYAGQWHFPLYSAGGAGNIDYMGDCAQNTLQFIVVGDGTLTIQTEIYGSIRNFNVWVGDANNPAQAFTGVLQGRYASGDSVEVTIDDTSAPDDCTRIIRITDVGGQSPGESCGGKMGWSEAVWVAA